ncbi:ankyrin repeat-containing protein [Tanacetum coccineum]
MEASRCNMMAAKAMTAQHIDSSQYNYLLKGWIYGSLNEEVLKNVVECESARDVWAKLESFYDPKIGSAPPVSIIHPKVKTRKLNSQDDSYHLHPQKSLYNTKLRNAAVKGCWREAKAILKNNIDAATEVISNNGNTMLHLAVVKGHNSFLKKLLNFIKKEDHIERRNSDGHTALHIAAIFDNKCAAELLVRKRKRLLQISDNEDNIPLLSAYYNMKLSTYVYLLEVSEADSVHLPFINSSYHF